MTVSRKTLFIIAITCLGLVIVLYAASRTLLLGGFVKLEQTVAQGNVQRVLKALDQNMSAADRFTYDRAATDETYKYMASPSGAYIQSLFGKDGSGTPATRRYNFVVLMDASGHIVVSRGRDIATNTIINIPESLKAHLSVTDPLFRYSTTNSKVSGALLLPEAALLVK